jgi:hypothetical protein
MSDSAAFGVAFASRFFLDPLGQSDQIKSFIRGSDYRAQPGGKGDSPEVTFVNEDEPELAVHVILWV